MAFEPSAEELALMVAGEKLYIGLLCWEKPQNPVVILVGKKAAAQKFNVPVED